MKKGMIWIGIVLAMLAAGCGGNKETEIEQSKESISTEKVEIKEESKVEEKETEENGLEDYMASLKEESDRLKDFLEQEASTQLEMNTTSKELYDLWDTALNYLWGEVKDTLSEEEFKTLLEEQRVWIAEKEQAVKKEGEEFEGGSMYDLIVNMKAAELTEERVYELYKLLK